MNSLTFNQNNRHNHVPIYSSESCGTFAAWSQKFRDYIEAACLKFDESVKIARLKICLAGTARQAFEELDPADKTTLDQALSVLTKVIDIPIRTQLAKQSLNLCRQNNNESVNSFVERLIPLVLAAYPDQNTNARKELLKAAFLEKIKDEIAFYVRIGISPQQSFEEIRVKALEVEDLNQSRKSKEAHIGMINSITQNSQITHNFSDDNSTTESSNNFQFQGYPVPFLNHNPYQNSHSSNQHSHQYHNQQEQHFCNYCRRFGHLIQSCRSLARKHGHFPYVHKNEDHGSSTHGYP